MTSLIRESPSRVVPALLVAIILGVNPSGRAEATSNTPPLDQRGQPHRSQTGPGDLDGLAPARGGSSSPVRPEVWLCAGERINDLLRPDAEWSFVKEHLSGIKLYVDQINQATPEQLAALARLAKEYRYQVAV